MKRINAKRIAERLGKDPAFIYRIKRGEYKCPIMLAGAIDMAARTIATELGLDAGMPYRMASSGLAPRRYRDGT